MDFSVLGALQVRDDHLRPAELTGTLQSVLLGVLVAHANQVVPVGTLADALWPAGPAERAAQRLQVHVHRLRTLLGPDRVTFQSGGYLLRTLPGEVDAERFESLVDEAAAKPREATGLLETALGLWRGTPYGGLDVAVLADEAARLTERRMTATEAYYDAALRDGRHAEVVAELTDLVRRYPLRERLHASLMIALHRGGRRADALAAYRQVRTTIVSELGLEPGRELRDLEQQILAGAERSTLARVPPDVPDFVGREAELAELDRLVGTTGIAAVAGTAGVGKTALAVHWAHRVRHRFPDGLLYVDLRGYGPEQPMSTPDALALFLRSLGLEGAAVPSDPAERAARYRTLLDRRRMLVVLDNALTADQVRPLLPGGPSCFVVVTSRDALLGLGARDGARRLTLDRPSRADARRMLGRMLGGMPGDRAGADSLVDRCARLPLALRIAATRPDVHLDAAVRASFSWSYQHLPPTAARVFRLLGRAGEVDAHTVAALAGLSLPAAKRTIGVLVHAHLLHETRDGRLRMHALLRAYAAELADDSLCRAG